MDNNEVLGHLLKIESDASALVDEAQAEADRRVTEAEKQNRAVFDERYLGEHKRLEDQLERTKEEARQRYQKELESYREKISSVNADTDRFSALLSRLVEGEG